MVEIELALTAAVRIGALVRQQFTLENGEFNKRRLWVRPEIVTLLRSGAVDKFQVERVRAALRRFVTGGRFTVVTARCRHREVESIGDIRELKGDPPPFVELRIRPPKHDLRFFGRFVARDYLVLTSYGMKSLIGHTGRAKPSIPNERQRCDDVFKAAGLKIKWVPADIEQSMTDARFI